MTVAPRYVVLDFMGGPFDGHNHGWTTDAVIDFPPRLATIYGVYELHQYSSHWYRYQWIEGGSS